jgi:hypothetical protein
MTDSEFQKLKRKADLWDAINVLWSFPGKTLEQVLELRAKELSLPPPPQESTDE